MSIDTQGILNLELESALGFNGYVLSGLWLHPDKQNLVYPVGNTVVIKRLSDGKQEFLHGHTDNISCLSVSRSGKYIASGQVFVMNSKAPLFVWDYAQRAAHGNFQHHKGKVEALAFSPSETYLASLGGLDDGSIVIWDLKTKQAISGGPASAGRVGQSFTVRFSNTNENIFISAGCETLRVWELDLSNKKIIPTECKTDKLKRIMTCVEISKDDKHIYCGTTTGDIMKVNMDRRHMSHYGPTKTKYHMGVTALKLLESGELLVGCGSGAFVLCSADDFKVLKKLQLDKKVTSITARGNDEKYFLGTEASHLYHFSLDDFKADLLSSCHNRAVTDVAMPCEKPEIFATCSEGDIRLWHTKSPIERLRITVPNVFCNALEFMRDSQSIISAWNDGKIRAFCPRKGNLLFTIHNAHSMGVTAIAGTSDSRRIISGGGEGQICVWVLTQNNHKLLQFMKEHKASVNCIKIRSDDKECVSVSSDRTCLIWDLVRFVSLQLVTANSVFQTVCYHPEEFQIIISGSNGKVTFWDLTVTTTVREMMVTQAGAIYGMDITKDGKYFVTGGDDKLVKVWDYIAGSISHVGIAHGGSITSVKICSRSRTLISTSADGGILRWKFPYAPMASETQGVANLELESAIGFNGHVFSGLWLHPDKENLVYPLGNTVIIKRVKDGKLEFLQGHTDNVTCVAVSRKGSFIASGQVNFMNHKAPLIIWDYANRAIYALWEHHKTKVEALAFSPNEKYLVSLGGLDDGSIVIWNIETKRAICGCQASAQHVGQCFTVRYSNTNDNIFVSAGNETLRVWELDVASKKIIPTECRTDKLKRVMKCIEISEDDQYIFCGTTTGDIMKINMNMRRLSGCGPVKTKYNLGVSVIKILKSGDLIVGSGSGTVALCSGSNFRTLKKVQVEKRVTSITMTGDDQKCVIGTEASHIYGFHCKEFKTELLTSCPTRAVKDVAIPFGTSEIFATCSEGDIRLWKINKSKELLRITVPNMTCNSLEFMMDGHSIISAWNDGKIRGFGPESGCLLFIIHNAHSNGVTAVAGTKDSKRIISGGGEGQVCVWELTQPKPRLLQFMKEHRSSVNCIKIKSDDKECVSVSSDRTCIIWDLERFVSRQLVTANSMFQTVCYHPEEFQMITSGTDGKVTFWDLHLGTAIREMVVTQGGAINAMDITQDGKHFVTGGNDKVVKVWDYIAGEMTHVGITHGGTITSVKICSNNRTLISTSEDGAILRWKFPFPLSS
ncbi:cilia- and flagella-associated protein 52 [Synchiropus picturatus]